MLTLTSSRSPLRERTHTSNPAFPTTPTGDGGWVGNREVSLLCCGGVALGLRGPRLRLEGGSGPTRSPPLLGEGG